MSSVIALSELKNEIIDLNREVINLRQGLGFTLNQMVEMTAKLEALEILLVEDDPEEKEAYDQLQDGYKSAVALEIGHG